MPQPWGKLLHFRKFRHEAHIHRNLGFVSRAALKTSAATKGMMCLDVFSVTINECDL